MKDIKHRLKISIEIVKAVKFLRDKCNLSHLDLKPENFVVWFENGEIRIKLIDFETALPSDRLISEKQNVIPGPEYRDPLNRWEENPTFDPVTSDTFSLGICLYVIFLIRYPV